MTDTTGEATARPWAAAGADGWRGVIGRNFTPAAVGALTTAVVTATGRAAAGRTATPLRVLVTHDGRRTGAAAARTACAAAAAAGAAGLRLVPHLPTPTATAALRLGHADLALLVTASHNPAHWNGVKVKVAPGCPPPRSLEEAVTRALADGPYPTPPAAPTPAAEPAELLVDAHLDEVLARLPDRPATGLTVVVDGLGGIAGAPLARLCARLGWRVHPADHGPDPDFGGLVPDPSRDPSRRRAAARVRAERADLGIVLDGDGDRVYLLDHRGRTLRPHELFALLLEHRYRDPRRARGAAVAITASTGSAVRRVAERYGATVHETGIGFKHMSPLLASGTVDAAGGAVGDFGFAEFGLDRDPFAVVVLLADLLARADRPLAALADGLRARTGGLTWFERHAPDSTTAGVPDLTATGVRALTGLGADGAVHDITTVDGVKLLLPHGQWLLLRASTTEGGVRVYGEGRDPATAAALGAAAVAVLAAA